MEGRREGREGGEGKGGRGGMEGEKEGGREGGKEGGREGGMEGGREGRREGREGRREEERRKEGGRAIEGSCCTDSSLKLHFFIQDTFVYAELLFFKLERTLASIIPPTTYGYTSLI